MGAGTAGSVLANRLSEVRQWKILVLEAGDVPPVLNDLGFLQEAYALTNLSWNILYEAEPQAGHGNCKNEKANTTHFFTEILLKV